jgi:signal transduction histidine kinase
MFLTGLALGAVAAVAALVPVIVLALRRAALRATLAERRARNAERMAEIGAMTGGLAHEIKNPLSTVGLNAQLLGEGIGELSIEPGDRDRLLRRVGVLRREVDRLRDILDGFLKFAGHIRLEKRRVDLVTLVEELSDFFLPQAQRHAVRLSVAPAPGPVYAQVDPDQLKQAVLNLMLNATQAMAGQPEDASAKPRELILRVEPQPNGPDGPTVRIRVTDTGPGVPPDVRDRVFAPYFTTKAGGSGLGLPITKRIVEEHGGRIELRSEPGRGTEFVLVLPVGPESVQPAGGVTR